VNPIAGVQGTGREQGAHEAFRVVVVGGDEIHIVGGPRGGLNPQARQEAAAQDERLGVGQRGDPAQEGFEDG
jgi:hypothetical protein